MAGYTYDEFVNALETKNLPTYMAELGATESTNRRR